VVKGGRDGEGLDDGAVLGVSLDLLVGLEGLGEGSRDGFHHVEVAGLNVTVSGGVVGVDLEGHAVVLGLLVTLIVRVLDEGDFLVVIPVVQLVRAIGDRLLAEGLRILVEGLGQRGEGRVADLNREHGVGLVQVDGEGGVVHDLEAGELLVTFEAILLQIVIAGDGGEEGGALLGVLGVGHVGPGLGEGLSGHRSAVGELPARLDLDGVLGGVIVRGDGLGHFVGSLAVLVEGDQTGEQQVDRLAAAGFVGVARDQRVLRFGVVRSDDVGASGVTGGSVAVGAAAGAQQHGHGAGHGSESKSFLLHMISPIH